MKVKIKKPTKAEKQLAVDFNYWCATHKWHKYPGIDKWFTTGSLRLPPKTTEELFELFFNKDK